MNSPGPDCSRFGGRHALDTAPPSLAFCVILRAIPVCPRCNSAGAVRKFVLPAVALPWAVAVRRGEWRAGGRARGVVEG